MSVIVLNVYELL